MASFSWAKYELILSTLCQAFLAEHGNSQYRKELLSGFFLPSGEIRMMSAQCELIQQN